MGNYQGILFDFDYTLADSTDGICESFWYAFDVFGLPRPSREAVRKTIGLSLERSFEELTGQQDPDRIAEFVRHYRKKADEVLLPKTRLFPQTRPMLDALEDMGVSLGVVTNKYHFRIMEALETFSLLDWFSVVVGADDVGVSKPDPAVLNRAAELLGMEKKAILYVGDSVVDAMTAQAADVPFLGVTTGTTAPSDFLAYPHVAVLPSVGELPDYLAKS